MHHEREYKMNPAYSQSDIKLFEEDPKSFHAQKVLGGDRNERKTDFFDVGDLTDIFLLQEKEKDRYHVISDFKASDTVKDIVRRVLTNVLAVPDTEVSTDLATYQEMFIPIVKEIEWYYNPATQKFSRKEDTLIANIIADGSDYFRQLINGRGKTEVTMESWNTADACIAKLNNDPDLKDIMTALNGNPPKGVEVVKAKAFFGSWGTFLLKILLDFALVDHNNKIVFPFDLKTCKSVSDFVKNYLKYRYIRQGAFYSWVLKQAYPEYRIAPFTFLVVPTEGGESPELFEMSTQELQAGTTNGQFGNGFVIPGWQTLLNDIEWHTKKDLWDHKRSYYENGMKNILNTFGSNSLPSKELF